MIAHASPRLRFCLVVSSATALALVTLAGPAVADTGDPPPDSISAVAQYVELLPTGGGAVVVTPPAKTSSDGSENLPASTLKLIRAGAGADADKLIQIGSAPSGAAPASTQPATPSTLGTGPSDAATTESHTPSAIAATPILHDPVPSFRDVVLPSGSTVYFVALAVVLSAVASWFSSSRYHRHERVRSSAPAQEPADW